MLRHVREIIEQDLAPLLARARKVGRGDGASLETNDRNDVLADQDALVRPPTSRVPVCSDRSGGEGEPHSKSKSVISAGLADEERAGDGGEGT